MTDSIPLTKARFFAQPTAARMKRRRVVQTGPNDSLDTIAQQVAAIDIATESLRITTVMFDETALPPEERRDGWDWRKSLPYVDITRIQGRSNQERIAAAYAFQPDGEERDHRVVGYGWFRRGESQVVGIDDTIRGAKLFKYEIGRMPQGWEELKAPIGVSIKKGGQYAERYGALADTTVSRMTQNPRADIGFHGVPVSKITDGLTLIPTGMCCKGRKYIAEHFRSPRNTVDKHHVAGAYKIALFEHLNGNDWTARRLPLLYPLQSAADYARALDLVFVSYDVDGRHIERPLECHEREALWTARARGNGFRDFSSRSKILELDWHTRD